MGVLKEVDRLYEESGKSQMFRDIKYVEREEDPELKLEFEQNE
jgi:hypothetical protein